MNPMDLSYWHRRCMEAESALEVSRRKVRQVKRRNNALKLAMKGSPDHLLNSCIRKKLYDTREEAQVNSQIDKGDGNGHAYKCKFCRGWHLSTIAKRIAGR